MIGVYWPIYQDIFWYIFPSEFTRNNNFTAVTKTSERGVDTGTHWPLPPQYPTQSYTHLSVCWGGTGRSPVGSRWVRPVQTPGRRPDQWHSQTQPSPLRKRESEGVSEKEGKKEEGISRVRCKNVYEELKRGGARGGDQWERHLSTSTLSHSAGTESVYGLVDYQRLVWYYDPCMEEPW